ncbi:MAG: Cys-tRNA(Pro) deacylase [Sphaerochaetaceae bacterium]|nr:Cys-tRNA(Pro) deacylase [Sphaerochaetaceae bacterium]
MVGSATKKENTVKTNAMRILQSNNVLYDVVTYEVDINHLDAIHAAKSANLNLEQVYKTIVMYNEKKELFVFCTPAEFDISFKKARALTKSSSLELVKLDELQKYTGYIRGGCSPLGMVRKYPTFIEEMALLEDKIYVSGGLRGVQIGLNPLDLAKCCNGSFESFT